MIDKELGISYKTNIANSIPKEKYRKLSDTEQLVITMLDSYASDESSTAWPCNYDQLMRVASTSPEIKPHEIMSVIGRLTEFQIIDSSICISLAKMEIWVSPWIYRAQLRHAISGELIKRRRVLIDSTTQASTSAAGPVQAA